MKYQWTINLALRGEPVPLCLLLHHKVICLLFTRRSTLRKRFYCVVYRQVLLCGSKQKIQGASDRRCTNPYPVGGSGRKLVKFGRKLLWSIKRRGPFPLRAISIAVPAAEQALMATRPLVCLLRNLLANSLTYTKPALMSSALRFSVAVSSECLSLR